MNNFKVETIFSGSFHYNPYAGKGKNWEGTRLIDGKTRKIAVIDNFEECKKAVETDDQ